MEEIDYEHDSQMALAYSRYRVKQNDMRVKTPFLTITPPKHQVSKTPRLSEIRSFQSKQRKERPILKKLLMKVKVGNAVKSFCSKLKRTVVTSAPQEIYSTETDDQTSKLGEYFRNIRGISLSSLESTFYCLFSIFSTVFLVTIYSLSLAFTQSELRGYGSSVGLSFVLVGFLLDICLNFLTRRYEQGRALIFIKQISVNYLRNRFIIDFINVIVLIFNISCQSNEPVGKVLRWVIILKVPELFEKVQILENLYITTFIREQYWGLFFVFLTNFTLAHFLSIVLNLMASLNEQSNWLLTKNLMDIPWHEKYVWGYYWGTTIMLTVGFGDLAATNCSQALCLIFIEMISCISLAYNINCVGNLISNLRKQSQEKSNNLKTFQLMAESNRIGIDLENQINNYIEESFLIKNQFNFQEQDNLLEGLPKVLKAVYLKEVNGKILTHLPFFKDLTRKSQNLLAVNLTRIITHPQEIILNKGDIQKVIVLEKGSLALDFGHSRSNKCGKPLQKLEVKENGASKLLSIGMIRESRLQYNLKSLSYSVLHTLQTENLCRLLRQDSMSFEYFCMMRDRPLTNIDLDEIHPCDNCPGLKHLKSKCPKLHYIPIRQIIILKNLKSHTFQPRKDVRRCKKPVLPWFVSNTQKKVRKLTINLRSYDDTNMADQLSDTDNLYGQSIIQRVNLNPQQGIVRTATSLQQVLPKLVTLRNLMYAADVNFWIVESDLMYNWKYYFTSSNPRHFNEPKIRDAFSKFQKNAVSQFN